ncbi:MAG: hypothetical protein R3F11_28865 [Verrucomicrobiales bacterium]
MDDILAASKLPDPGITEIVKLPALEKGDHVIACTFPLPLGSDECGAEGRVRFASC